MPLASLPSKQAKTPPGPAAVHSYCPRNPEHAPISAGRRPIPTLFKCSAAWHAAGATTIAVAPPTWPWVVGALAANHALIVAAGLLPRSRLLGPNLTRLPATAARRREVALTFDDGPDPEVTPAVLDLLDAHKMQASFFCIGARAAAHPTLVREIVRRGHSVENHSQRHSLSFAFSGAKRFRREIHTAQETLGALVGVAPRYFRAPAGLRNLLLDSVLAGLDLQLVSWTRRGFDGVSADDRAVFGRLTHRLAAGDILVLHDGTPPRAANNVPVVLTVLPPLLRHLQAAGLRSVSLPQAFAQSPIPRL